jgi:hypothetical protein
VVLERPEEISAPPATEDLRRPAATSPLAGLLGMPETTRVEMEAKRDAIRAELHERTPPLLKQRFDAGQSEFVSEEQKYAMRAEDESDIYSVTMPAGGKGTYRTVLPRADYPELYELHDAAARLDKAITKKKIEEFVANQERQRAAQAK